MFVIIYPWIGAGLNKPNDLVLELVPPRLNAIRCLKCALAKPEPRAYNTFCVHSARVKHVKIQNKLERLHVKLDRQRTIVPSPRPA